MASSGPLRLAVRPVTRPGIPAFVLSIFFGKSGPFEVMTLLRDDLMDDDYIVYVSAIFPGGPGKREAGDVCRVRGFGALSSSGTRSSHLSHWLALYEQCASFTRGCGL